MPDRNGLPCTHEEIAEAAHARGLELPAACMGGVAANLALLSRHADRIKGRDGEREKSA